MGFMSRLTQEELAAVIAVLDSVPEKTGSLRSAHSKLVTDHQRRTVARVMVTQGALAPIETRPRVSFAHKFGQGR